jgi:phosphoribosylaminoimidazole-succinocarboxamide synthase
MGLAALGVEPNSRGKVREIVAAGDDWVIITTDRISAFDHVLPTGIPEKGAVLNRLAGFWFRGLESVMPTHFVGDAIADLPPSLAPFGEILSGRFMRVRRADRFPVECIVRGWLTGSGYVAYSTDGAICGVKLPAGLAEFDRLPEPIFTPTTKAEEGHDEPMTFEDLAQILGRDTAAKLRDRSLEIYARGAAYAERRGVVIADAKFEFGRIDGRIAVIDELLTPDSSRFWPADSVGRGKRPVSLDKQFVRDYLIALGWNRMAPAPPLPADVVEKTRERYAAVANRLIAGAERPEW